MEKEKKYQIKPGYEGCDVYTIPPFYSRPDGGKFTLDEKLSQKDLGYLFEVIGHEGVELKK